MDHIRRRQLLAGLSVAGLSGTVGCADFQLSGNSPTQICEITVINQYPEQVRSTLKITRKSDVLVESTVDLDSPTQTADTHNLPANELPPKSEYEIMLTVTGDGWNLEDEYAVTDENLDSTALMWLVESNSHQEAEPTLQLFTSQEDASC